MGRIEGIWVKRAHRGLMDAVLEAALVAGQGLAGSVGRSRRRQVTLLEREAWERCLAEVGASADPARRRANILVSGLTLARTRGRVLVLGFRAPRGRRGAYAVRKNGGGCAGPPGGDATRLAWRRVRTGVD